MPGLPDFDNPPVIETVLGLQFTPLSKFDVPHYGLYWEKIRRSYDRFEVHPPIVSTVDERGSDAPLKGQIFINFPSGNNFRCWFIDESKNNLLQVQRETGMRLQVGQSTRFYEPFQRQREDFDV